MPILLDRGVAPGAYVVGANEPDAHLRGVEPGRDFRFEHADIRTVVAGDTIDGATDPHRARDRGRQHLQAGHPVLRAAERHLPGRVGQGAADLDGVLRLRAGAGRRRGGRAVRRRAGDLLAPGDRAVRRGGRDAGQGGQRGARVRRRGSTASSRSSGSRSLYDERDAGPGEKFIDAELLGCPLRVTVGRRTLGAGEVEVQLRRGAERRRACCSRTRRRRSRSCGAGSRDRRPRGAPMTPDQQAAADRHRPLRAAARRHAVRSPTEPVDDPQRDRLPAPGRHPGVPDRARSRARDGHDALAVVLFAVIGWSDYLDGFLARLTGQYSRLGALLDPVVDRL